MVVADKKTTLYLYSLKELTGGLCTIIIFLYTISQSSLFFFQPMLDEVADGMISLAEQLDTDAIFLTTNDQIPGPLRFVFRKNVYQVNAEPEYDPNFNGQVYFISERADILSNFDTSYQLVSNQRVSGQFPKKTIGSYPSELVDWGWDFSVFRVEPGNNYITYDLTVNSCNFGSQNSELLEADDGRGIRTFISNGTEGFLLFGPYVSLESGNYSAEFHIRIVGSMQYELGRLEVYSKYSAETSRYSEESQVFAYENLTINLFNNEHEAVVLPFSLPIDKNDIEYRIFVTEGTILQVEKVIIRRLE